MTLNRPVLAVIVITSALLTGALSSGSGIQDADRAGTTTMSEPPSLSNQALFSRNLAHMRQLKQLVPLRQMKNNFFSRRIGSRLRERFLSQDQINGEALSSGRTVVSLVIDEDDLNDATLGIAPNNYKKGSAWERPGLISIYRNQRLLMRARAGIRIHGGAKVNSPHSSFRLYFRDAYGVPDIAMSKIIPGAPGQLRRLIINKTDGAFRNAIAFSISRRIGGIAPYTVPAEFYLNGTPQGTRLLIEHVGIDFLNARFGHKNFTFLRMKGGTREGHGSRWQTLTEHFNRKEIINVADTMAVIDLENLMRQYAAFLFCAVGDAFQGGIVKDDSSWSNGTSNRWFFVNWDMEDSFGKPLPNYFKTLGYGPPAPPVLRPLLWHKLSNDPAFQRRFSILMNNLLDNALTNNWIDKTITDYRKLAAKHGMTEQGELDEVEAFIRARPDQLRRELAAFMNDKST